MIRTNEITFAYTQKEQPALQQVFLTVSEGECVVLCGQSGCGKTTFLRLLNGLIPELFAGELSGEGSCGGLSVGKSAVTDFVPFVGSVFQNPKTQYFNVDTTSELAFPCENAGMASEKIKARIAECAKLLALESLLGRSIFKLSGGEKQRIAFGAACMLSPKLLVLDEPTSNLDAPSTERLHDLIGRMKQKGITIVIAEHRLSWIADLADKYVYFKDGKMEEIWETEELLHKPAGFLEARGLRPLDVAPYREAVRRKEEGLDASLQGAGEAKSLYLSAKNLKAGYQKKCICSLENLYIYKGEILCLMGANGAGKSTLVKTLCGLQKPVGGEIFLHADCVSGKKGNTEASKEGIKKAFLETPEASARKDFIKAARKDLIAKSFLVMQDVNYQLFADSVEEEVLLGAKEAARCQEVLAALQLDTLAKRHPMSLSGGQKQRVAIASAILSGKEFIVFDEPTSGLDFYHMTQVSELIKSLKEAGAAVLVVTHDEELCALLADRILRIYVA